MKLDLHTHCFEAYNFAPAEQDVAMKIVEKARSQGLDGIVITDHESLTAKKWAYQIARFVDDIYGGEFLVIPGQEVDIVHCSGGFGAIVLHVIELYLPDRYTFRFLAHPGYPPSSHGIPWSRFLDGMQGIELENASAYRGRPRPVAFPFGLPKSWGRLARRHAAFRPMV